MSSVNSRKTQKQQRRIKENRKKANIARIAKKPLNMKAAMREMKKISQNSKKTYAELGNDMANFKNNLGADYKKNINAMIAKLNGLRINAVKLNNAESISSLDIKIAYFKNILVQYDQLNKFDYLANIDLSDYVSNPEHFIEDIFKAEEKLKENTLHEFKSLVNVLGSFSTEEFLFLSPMTSRFVRYILESDLENTFLIIMTFMTRLELKEPAFMEVVNDICKRIDPSEREHFNDDKILKMQTELMPTKNIEEIVT